METLEAARAIYEEEAQTDQSATSLAERLHNRAEETHEDVARILDQGANDLRSSLGNVQTIDLPDNIAGRARIGIAGSSEIDIHAIASDGPKLIDTEAAEAVRLHEERHEKQRQGDSAGVQVGDAFLSAHDLYEWDAMEHETGHVLHSADYEEIRARVSAVLSYKDRTLVVRGEFQKLEQQKDEEHLTNAA